MHDKGTDREYWNIIDDEFEISEVFESIHGETSGETISSDISSVGSENVSFDEFIHCNSSEELNMQPYKQEILQLFADSNISASSISPRKELPGVITRVLEPPPIQDRALVPMVIKPVDQLSSAEFHTITDSNFPMSSSIQLPKLDENEDSNAKYIPPIISDGVKNAYDMVNQYIFEAYKHQWKTQSATNMLNRMSEELENRRESIDIDELKNKCYEFTGYLTATSTWVIDEAKQYVKQLPMDDWVRSALQAKNLFLNEIPFTDNKNNDDHSTEMRIIHQHLIPTLEEKQIPFFDGTDFKSWFNTVHYDFQRLLAPLPELYLIAVKIYSEPEARDKLENVFISQPITCSQLIQKLHAYFEGEELYTSESSSIVLL